LIKLTEKRQKSKRYDGTLSLSIDMRVRSRARVILDDGKEAGLFLERGTILRGGDFLTNSAGTIVKVIAAKETVSTVYCNDPLLLTKAAYHLGNRHVPLQIEPDWLRYQHDPVLDEMLKLMGLEIFVDEAEFEPESGAYQQQSHGHHHG